MTVWNIPLVCIDTEYNTRKQLFYFNRIMLAGYVFHTHIPKFSFATESRGRNFSASGKKPL